MTDSYFLPFFLRSVTRLGNSAQMKELNRVWWNKVLNLSYERSQGDSRIWWNFFTTVTPAIVGVNQTYTGGGFPGAAGSGNDNIPAAYLNLSHGSCPHEPQIS